MLAELIGKCSKLQIRDVLGSQAPSPSSIHHTMVLSSALPQPKRQSGIAGLTPGSGTGDPSLWQLKPAGRKNKQTHNQKKPKPNHTQFPRAHKDLEQSICMHSQMFASAYPRGTGMGFFSSLHFTCYFILSLLEPARM